MSRFMTVDTVTTGYIECCRKSETFISRYWQAIFSSMTALHILYPNHLFVPFPWIIMTKGPYIQTNKGVRECIRHGVIYTITSTCWASLLYLKHQLYQVHMSWIRDSSQPQNTFKNLSQTCSLFFPIGESGQSSTQLSFKAMQHPLLCAS